ncbi:MAG: trypsin-like peptidase domain-containing protein [Chloroflexi bacterium]|nr:trypsin-like peptidase domain-containing protein [Chloroflexota bacterium]
MPLLLPAFDEAMADLIAVGRRSLVQISNLSTGVGAGTIWHPDGLIVTNAHVVQHARDLRVTLDTGETLRGAVAAIDPAQDLAAVIVEAHGLPCVTLGKPRAVRSGQWVVAIGHPFGTIGAATAGTVIGLVDGLPEYGGASAWIALSLSLRPGHSGGPLLDASGRLVGINTMITGPEVGYAVPVQTAAEFLKHQVRVDVIRSA